MKTVTYCSFALLILFGCAKSDPDATTEPNTGSNTSGVQNQGSGEPTAKTPAKADEAKNTKTDEANKAKPVKGGCEYGNIVRSAEPGVGPGPKGGHSCAAKPDTKPLTEGVSNHYGAKFNGETSVGLGDVFANPTDFSGKKIQISGKITKVCKKKGCWFVMQADAKDKHFMRVTMHNYGFFVPLDCDGKDAVVEGVFRSIEVPESARKHLAEDGNEDPSKVKGSAVEHTMIATGVRIKG